MGSSQTPSIPPSSLTQFISTLTELESRSVVITDHSAEYVNPFYHSHFDDEDNVDTELVCDAATFLARTLFQLSIDTAFDLSAFLNSKINEDASDRAV
jgi:hypothetical protein